MHVKPSNEVYFNYIFIIHYKNNANEVHNSKHRVLITQTQLQVNHHSVSDWTKYDERLIECVENGDVDKLK